jgi:hypothetical protein
MDEIEWFRPCEIGWFRGYEIKRFPLGEILHSGLRLVSLYSPEAIEQASVTAADQI